MTRDWKISLSVAILSHVGLLFAFRHIMPHPARLTRDSVMEITMTAAPAEAAPVENSPAAVAVEPAPIVENPPAPPTVNEPQRPAPPVRTEPRPTPPLRELPKLIEPSRPTPPSPTPLAEQPVSLAAKAPPSSKPAIGDGSAVKPGADSTTKRAEAGIPAKPHYRKNPEPPYPSAARRRRQEGSVLLSVKVSAEGRAISVALKQSSGHAVLDAAALEAVREWEFEPARLGATPIASDIEVPVRFQLKP